MHAAHNLGLEKSRVMLIIVSREFLHADGREQHTLICKSAPARFRMRKINDGEMSLFSNLFCGSGGERE